MAVTTALLAHSNFEQSNSSLYLKTLAQISKLPVFYGGLFTVTLTIIFSEDFLFLSSNWALTMNYLSRSCVIAKLQKYFSASTEMWSYTEQGKTTINVKYSHGYKKNIKYKNLISSASENKHFK